MLQKSKCSSTNAGPSYILNDNTSKMISSVRFLCLLLIGAVVVSATSDGTVNQFGVASNLRGSVGESNNVILAARSLLNTPATPTKAMSIIEYHGVDAKKDITSVTISLRVFLSDTPRLLDDVNRFEQDVVAFISDNTTDAGLFIDGVVWFTSASVIEQRLTWEKDTSSIGLEVHFQVYASVSVSITHNRLKKATQRLLNKRNDVFKLYLEKSSEEIADTNEANAMKFESLRPPIGFATAAIGLCGMIASVGYVYWKMRIKTTERKESKPKPTSFSLESTEINSKPTLETSESFDDDNDSYLDHSLTFPMQYNEKQPEEWDDVSGPDDFTDDGSGSFNASVVFCPSVEQRGLGIRAHIEDNTDSDSDGDDDASVKKNRSTPLSPESLQEFDTALRRAEI